MKDGKSPAYISSNLSLSLCLSVCVCVCVSPCTRLIDASRASAEGGGEGACQSASVNVSMLISRLTAAAFTVWYYSRLDASFKYIHVSVKEIRSYTWAKSTASNTRHVTWCHVIKRLRGSIVTPSISRHCSDVCGQFSPRCWAVSMSTVSLSLHPHATDTRCCRCLLTVFW